MLSDQERQAALCERLAEQATGESRRSLIEAAQRLRNQTPTPPRPKPQRSARGRGCATCGDKGPTPEMMGDPAMIERELRGG